MLARIREKIDAEEYSEAAQELDTAFKELMGMGADQICALSDTELLARLTAEGPTHALPQKIRLLVALLQEAGEIRDAEFREEECHACWLTALNLLLNLQMGDEDCALVQFVPTVDLLREQLRDEPLPLATLAALWRHNEKIGAYAKAEDALAELLEAEPNNPDLITEAKSFYERLLRKGDRALEEGNLPRSEVISALENLKTV